MDLREAFLRDILTNPDDVAPRLVYADWLTDHGNDSDRDHSEFIRAQCELERLADEDPRRATLERRARELLKNRRKQWTEPLTKAKLGKKHVFRRGFVEELTLEAERFVGVADSLFALAPVRLIHFPYAVRETSQLAASPHLARLSGADLEWMCTCGMCPIHDELHELYASPHVRNLTKLSLAHNRMDPAEVVQLCRSPNLAQLESLDLSQNAIGGRGIRHLAESPYLTKLTSLDLSGDELGVEDVRLLAELPRFRNLKELRLGSNGLGVTAARVLANSANLAGLRVLGLMSNRIGEGGAKALANSKYLGELTQLDVRFNNLGASAKKALRARFGKRVKA